VIYTDGIHICSNTSVEELHAFIVKVRIKFPIGSIRVGNKRADAAEAFKLDLGEEAINIDRGNSVLANPYRICASLSRKQCIALYRADLLKDIKAKGPMYQELARLAKLVTEGKQIVLLCWCKPLPCHGDVIVEQVERLI
jgi:hypothetical protein